MPFGHGIVGWREACQRYWSQSCEYLDEHKLFLLYVSSKESRSLRNVENHPFLVSRAVALNPRLSEDTLEELLKYSLSERFAPYPLDPRVEQYVTMYDQSKAYKRDLSLNIDQLLDRTAPQRKKYGIQDCCVVVVDQY